MQSLLPYEELVADYSRLIAEYSKAMKAKAAKP